MAPLPKNSINHFIHPNHLLTSIETNQEYLCDGCKTTGTGKRYRCHTCNFDLHEYCGTCPTTLVSFMHNHALTLVMRKQGPKKVDRVCDVCSDPVEGLFYRCKICEFDVHPLCTQLPKQLQHALHKVHPLNLESPGIAGICAVCRNMCSSWRYRCKSCNFDIHLECVLVPIVPCPGPGPGPTNQRSIPTRFDQGIPFQPSPQFVPYYAHGFANSPGFPPMGHGPNMYYNQYMYPYQQNFTPQNQVSASSNGTGRKGKSMFSLVGQLGFGVLSNMIFGVDIVSLFTG